MAADLKKFARWEKTRARGRTQFIWVNGVLMWGVLTGVLWSLAMPVMQPEMSFLKLLPLALAGFPAGGYLWGVLVWRAMEKKYQDAIAEKP